MGDEMKLVPDWRGWWRWHSVWLAAVIAALPSAWAAMPPDLVSYIPADWLPYVSGVMFVAFMVGRLRDQE